MLIRRQVLDKVDVLRPRKFVRIHRAADDEPPLWQFARGTDEQSLHPLLPVGGVFAAGGHLDDGLVEAVAAIQGEQHGFEVGVEGVVDVEGEDDLGDVAEEVRER